MTGQILEQLTAHSHIEQLHSPADGQYRQIRGQGAVQQVQFQGVEGAAQFQVGGRVGFGVVQSRVNVGAAGEEQAANIL